MQQKRPAFVARDDARGGAGEVLVGSRVVARGFQQNRAVLINDEENRFVAAEFVFDQARQHVSNGASCRHEDRHS